MSWSSFAILTILCSLAILLCRVVPIFALKGRELSSRTEEALSLIPPAAFAALVANDLLSPDMFVGGLWEGLFPLIASLIVVIVAIKTKNLLWCALVGVIAYGLLLLVPFSF